MISLRVASTWDGLPVPPSDHAELALVGKDDHLELRVDARFYGDPAPSQPPGPVPGLWDFEVVELFIAGAEDRYLEVELGPWGHHLVLRLAGIRNVVEWPLPLDLVVGREGARWTARALLPRSWLPPGPHRVNAYTIHGEGPARRYLAAHPVPGEAPDFHRLDCFETVVLP